MEKTRLQELAGVQLNESKEYQLYSAIVKHIVDEIKKSMKSDKAYWDEFDNVDDAMESVTDGLTGYFEMLRDETGDEILKQVENFLKKSHGEVK